MSTLKPCPFCAGKPRLDKGLNVFVDAQVTCDDCGTTGPIFGADAMPGDPSDFAQIAADHWNTRKEPA